MPEALLIPMAAHVVWAAFLYGLLTVARAPSVWGIGLRPDGSNPWAEYETRISANLSNQFEWPLFFHVACLLCFLVQPSATVVTLAWIFMVGRLAHSTVQILMDNVRLRGVVFTINFLAVLGIWVEIVLATH